MVTARSFEFSIVPRGVYSYGLAVQSKVTGKFQYLTRGTRVLQKVTALYFLKNLYLCYRHENSGTFQYNLPSSRYI